ncbi:MAG TPA: PIN domain-containing protein [Dehalococcoidia bacterium]|nr:PIN domain-containing protein [Dehalococcoidia bacterium]
MTAPGPVVVDTNVVVYLILGRGLAQEYSRILRDRDVLVSFQTLAELRLIALRRTWGPRLLATMDEVVGQAGIIQPTLELVEEWAQLMYRQMQRGSRIESADAWVAASALLHGCPVLTNDRKDFERIQGLRLLPP